MLQRNRFVVGTGCILRSLVAIIQSVPLIHEHLGSRMELDNGSSNAMDMGSADAEWLIRNAQELNGESTRSDFLRNYMLCPDV
jgi:hypothetical protein